MALLASYSHSIMHGLSSGDQGGSLKRNVRSTCMATQIGKRVDEHAALVSLSLSSIYSAQSAPSLDRGDAPRDPV